MTARNRFTLPEKLRGFQPTHHGHLQIHNHDVIRILRDSVERFPAVIGDIDGMSKPFENPRRQLLVDQVVFAEKDSQPKRFDRESAPRARSSLRTRFFERRNQRLSESLAMNRLQQDRPNSKPLTLLFVAGVSDGGQQQQLRKTLLVELA